MQAPKSSSGRYYRPELDVVRFLAFMLIFFHHTLPHYEDPLFDHIFKSFAPLFYASAVACTFGLSLFFTLSAFLICELLLRERESRGAIEIKQFYIRRILRIWPLYYLALGLALIFRFVPGGQPGDLAAIGWLAIFMGAWHTALYGWSGSFVVGPLWSISVEEQFYLFAPWALKCFNRKSLYGFCLLLILAANGWLYYLGRVATSYTRVWCDSIVQFECFAAGILLCLVLRGRMPRIAVWQRLILMCGCFACWVTPCYRMHFFFNGVSDSPGSWGFIAMYALASLGSVLMLVAFLGVNPKLLPGWTIYLGRISFGLYVYHGFALYIMFHLLSPVKNPVHYLKDSLALGMTILMAAVSYRYFETPFLKMKKRHSIIESQPIQGIN
jgi:peptidoglycan/LPS O-acetylase OafA/YrhL